MSTGRIVIAGGGTAGHLLPGLAVAEALVERGVGRGDVWFFGAARGVEARLVPDAGFEVELLPGRGVQRRLTAANVAAVWGLARAMVRAVVLLRRHRPRVVLCLGGYASVAAALAAVVWRVPLVVSEQNARAGAVNRLAGRFARASAVPFPGTDLPRSVVCGNPVRPEIRRVAAARDRDGARAAIGVEPGRRVIVAFAGSLGARTINEAVVGLVEQWADRGDLHVHHVVGARDWETLPRPAPSRLSYREVRYEERMDLVLAAADVAVCRAGGTTVAELAAVGVPALLVPLPVAPRDHQTANARPLVDAGAAVLVPDAECTPERLATELGALLDGDRLAAMASAARALGRPDAAAQVAELVLRHAR